LLFGFNIFLGCVVWKDFAIGCSIFIICLFVEAMTSEPPQPFEFRV